MIQHNPQDSLALTNFQFLIPMLKEKVEKHRSLYDIEELDLCNFMFELGQADAVVKLAERDKSSQAIAKKVVDAFQIKYKDTMKELLDRN